MNRNTLTLQSKQIVDPDWMAKMVISDEVVLVCGKVPTVANPRAPIAPVNHLKVKGISSLSTDEYTALALVGDIHVHRSAGSFALSEFKKLH